MLAGPGPIRDPTRAGGVAGLPREHRARAPRPPRRARWQLTLVGIALLVVIALVRGLHAIPSPKPSHRSPAAAVAGYLQGVGRGSSPEMLAYLTPPVRDQAAASIQAIHRLHVVVAAVVVTGVDLGRDRAVVQLVATVCFQAPGAPQRCDPLDRHPLGLTSDLGVVRRSGGWYVSQPIRPRP
ncbi:MAG TPA: hypothetical protein VMW47_07945 [Verrucomicrobiae bacterium]|nr:hypothetical protein [Verrucomicrobiae bacterium]